MAVPRFSAFVAFVVFALAGCAHGAREPGSADSPTAPSASRGAALFAENCEACHGRKGEGGRIGPSLTGIGKRATTAAIRTAIAHPDPPMPKLYPSKLSKHDLDDLAAYVGTL